MGWMSHSLKQLLAVVVSLNLVDATVPPPPQPAADSQAVRSYKQVPSSSAGSKNVAAQAATLVMNPEVRSSAEGEERNLIPDGTKPVTLRGTLNGGKPRVPPFGMQSLRKPEVSGRITTLGNHDLTFIENEGQFDERVKMQLKANGRTVWLTNNEISFDFLLQKSTGNNSNYAAPRSASKSGQASPRPENLEHLVISEDFIGAKEAPTIEPKNPQPGIYNYFLGNDPTKWRTDVRGYGEATYRDIWNGIDLRLYGRGSDLEQEFLVQPGADVAKIQVAYKGIQRLEIAQDGSLHIHTTFGELRESKPRIYQDIGGTRVPVEGRFKLTSETAYMFEVVSARPEYALVIDPTLLYSTYLGGGQPDEAHGIAVDANGNAYVYGITRSADFPTTPNTLQPHCTDSAVAPSECASAQPLFIAKLDATGKSLIYSTYISGTSGQNDIEAKGGIAVDSGGNAYITGDTTDPDFPTTPNALQPAPNGGGEAVVVKLNPTGSTLLYSTYLGGGPEVLGQAIAIDKDGRVYITGEALEGFPVTQNAFQRNFAGGQQSALGGDAFVAKIDPSMNGASSLIYATYLGGDGADDTTGIGVDGSGNAYVVGQTNSTNFPTTSGAFQVNRNSKSAGCGGQGSCADVFVTKLNSDGSSLIYSSFLGGRSSDLSGGIAVDSFGSAYVAGSTTSPDFPTKNAVQSNCQTFGSTSCTFTVYVTKFNPSGTAVAYSTYLGGGHGDSASAIAVDSSGNAYVTGMAGSSTFPIVGQTFSNDCATPRSIDPLNKPNCADAFVSELNPSGTALVFSTFIGGSASEAGNSIAVDSLGGAYVVGNTNSVDFPVTSFVIQPRFAGNGDAFVFKLSGGPGGTVGPLGLSGILPRVGGDTGFVTAFISGSGLLNGATLKLTRPGQTDIVGGLPTIRAGGHEIDTRFDLRGVARGAWDVVVTNPDETSATIPGGFTVEPGTAPDVWVDIVGPSLVGRADAPFDATFYVLYGNRGNVDAIGVPVWFVAPANATITPLFKVAPPPLMDGEPQIDFSQVPLAISDGMNQKLPILVTIVQGSGVVGVLPIRVSLPGDGRVQLKVFANPPYFDTSGLPSPALQEDSLEKPRELLLESVQSDKGSHRSDR